MRIRLAAVGAERTTWRCRGGDLGARFQQMSLQLLCQGTGVISEAGSEALQRAYADPAFAFDHLAMVDAWGRRAAEAS